MVYKGNTLHSRGFSQKSNILHFDFSQNKVYIAYTTNISQIKKKKLISLPLNILQIYLFISSENEVVKICKRNIGCEK